LCGRAAPAPTLSRRDGSASPGTRGARLGATEQFGRRIDDRDWLDFDHVRFGVIGDLDLHRRHVIGDLSGL
jgi:hypothetical protein